MEDLISRQAVIDACDQSINLFEAVDRIKELAPVTPQPKTGHWIPVSERLPEDNKNVLAWAKSRARDSDTCFVGCCDKGFWFLQKEAGYLSYPLSQYKVVAWMSLPEPYREVEE